MAVEWSVGVGGGGEGKKRYSGEVKYVRPIITHTTLFAQVVRFVVVVVVIMILAGQCDIAPAGRRHAALACVENRFRNIRRCAGDAELSRASPNDSEQRERNN